MATAVVGAAASVGAVVAGLAGEERPVRAIAARLGGARFHGRGDGVLQRAANDCGPAALAHCLRRVGRPAPYPDPESRVVLGPRGCSLGQLAAEASRRGWPVVVRRIEPPELESVTPPAILHLRHGHFVVWEGRRADDRWGGHDPALGRVSWSRTALRVVWGGEILYGAGSLPTGEGAAAGPVGRSEAK